MKNLILLIILSLSTLSCVKEPTKVNSRNNKSAGNMIKVPTEATIINGDWSEWIDVSACDNSTGLIAQSRSCTNPIPANGGSDCSGPTTQVSECAVNGDWSTWNNTGTCDSGTGLISQTRSCSNPLPKNGGMNCSGPITQSSKCAVNGDWSAWNNSGTCDSGTGLISQTRSCTNPLPKNGGANCSGPSTQSSKCAVNGVWNTWSNTGTCDSGTGLISQTRYCTNPPPKNGGANCSGPSAQSISCASNGGWSEWANTGTCDSGTGLISQTRSCTNPPPKNGGANCSGPTTQSSKCAINGEWSTWSNTGTCNSGTGLISQTRSCTNPPPKNGGANCLGAVSQSVACPIDGGWSNWTNSGTCNVSKNLLSQTRICNNPEPKNGGNKCSGEASRESPCKRNGGWGPWLPVGTCNSSTKLISQMRACNNPEPINGAGCNGKTTQDVTCNPITKTSACQSETLCVHPQMPVLRQGELSLVPIIRELSGLSYITKDNGWCAPVASTMALAAEKIRVGNSVKFPKDLENIMQIPLYNDLSSRTAAYGPTIFAVGEKLNAEWGDGRTNPTGTNPTDAHNGFKAYLNEISSPTKSTNSDKKFTSRTNQEFINLYQLIDKAAMMVTIYSFDELTGAAKSGHALTINGYEDGHIKIYDPWGRIYNIDIVEFPLPTGSGKSVIQFSSGSEVGFMQRNAQPGTTAIWMSYYSYLKSK